MKCEYRQYHFSKREILLNLLASAGLCVAFDYLFYQSFWALLAFPAVTIVFFKLRRNACIKLRRKELNYQFKDALDSLSVALQAGYSVENAVSSCIKDLEKLYKKKDDILVEFTYIEAQLQVNVPIEELFTDFGNRSDIEDISNFASVFSTAKRSGGDMVEIMQKTARTLGDKIEVKKEIEATISGKKSEQMIMSLMPFAIILYMQVTSPGFLEVLYGNFFGAATMTICLGLYFLAYWLGKKIVDIEV